MEKIKVRKASTIYALDELPLGWAILSPLAALPVSEVIWSARMGTLTDFAGIGKKRAAEIRDAVAYKGFLLEDGCENWRQLLYKVGVLEPPQTNQEYEDQIAFTPEVIKGIKGILGGLKPLERMTLEVRFGLPNRVPTTLSDAGMMLGISAEQVRSMESLALRRLRHPSRLPEWRQILGDDVFKD